MSKKPAKKPDYHALNGRVKTEKKSVSSRGNAVAAVAARRKTLSEIPCGCRVDDNEFNPDAHLKSCLRRRAILRRIAQNIPFKTQPD